MRQRIQNNISLQVDGIDFSKCSNIKVYVAQAGITHEYAGTVDGTDKSIYHVQIPKSDAMTFKYGEAEIQLALTDSSGNPRASNPVRIKIGKLLKGEGYGS